MFAFALKSPIFSGLKMRHIGCSIFGGVGGGVGSGLPSVLVRTLILTSEAQFTPNLVCVFLALTQCEKLRNCYSPKSYLRVFAPVLCLRFELSAT